MKLDAEGLGDDVLRLELLRPEHLKILEENGAADELWSWMPSIPQKTHPPEAYFDYLLKQLELRRTFSYCLFRKVDNAFAGFCMFDNIRWEHRGVRIDAIWHPVNMRGTGIYQRVQLILTQRAFDCGARRVAWVMDGKNTRGLRALSRLGLKQEGILREFMRTVDGRWANIHSFSLLRSEHSDFKQRLQQQIDRVENHLG